MEVAVKGSGLRTWGRWGSGKAISASEGQVCSPCSESGWAAICSESCLITP